MPGSRGASCRPGGRAVERPCGSGPRSTSGLRLVARPARWPATRKHGRSEMPRDARSPARATDETFGALVRLYLSPANAKWATPPPAGWTDGTRRIYVHELNCMARPDMLGNRPREKLRPSLVQAY